MTAGFYHPNNVDPLVTEAQDALNYANLAKDWAIKLGETVNGIDYSAQYHALDSKTSAQNSATSAAASAGSATLAGQYANYTVDVFVPGTSDYSSMHWAAKAFDSATAAATSEAQAEAAALAAVTAKFATIATDASTARTLIKDDAGTYIRFTNAGAVTVTVPDDLTEAWSDGDEIHFHPTTAGTVTLSPGAGVTINAPSSGGLVLAEAHATATLKKVGPNEWDLFGLVSA